MGLLFEPVTNLAIDEVSDLKSIELEWHQVWRELLDPMPFQNFAWIQTAAANLPPEEIRVLVANSTDRLVGIIPLFGEENLRLLGGRAADYQDALIIPGYEQLVMNAIMEHLRDQPHRWSSCDWENLRANSALLLSDFGSHYTDTVEAQAACPILFLEGPTTPSTGLPRSVPMEQQERAHAYVRRAQRAGRLTIQSATWETLDEIVDEMFRLRRFPDGAIEQFHRAAVPGLMRAEILRLYALRLDAEIIGVYYGFVCGERAFFHMCGVNHGEDELNPQAILIAHAIGEAVRERVEAFDFLRSTDPSIYAWGAHNTYTYRRAIRRV